MFSEIGTQYRLGVALSEKAHFLVYDRFSSMFGTRVSTIEREALDDLWQGTIAHIISAYGRLVYLAGLRHPDTGRYEYFGVTANASTADANRALRHSHEHIFQDWINLPLKDKMDDVKLYISSLGPVEKAELIDAWLRLTPYKNLVPASIQGPERQKHVSDFEAILGLLKNVFGVASPDPNA
jgi:hypothetical protein